MEKLADTAGGAPGPDATASEASGSAVPPTKAKAPVLPAGKAAVAPAAEPRPAREAPAAPAPALPAP
eukprot:342829-Alexandrium_andersonii.AAC.1